MKNSKFGFTLAEVLITLVVIGVVAALTLAPAIKKYKAKALENQFKKTSSTIENALMLATQELGYNKLKDMNTVCGTNSSNMDSTCVSNFKNTGLIDFENTFLSKLQVAKSYSGSYKCQGLYPNGKAKNFNGDIYSADFFYIDSKCYILKDGSMIANFKYMVHNGNDGLTLAFDTNGPKKGPNRAGYDIFLWNNGTWNKLCTKVGSSVTSVYNYRGCYDYAIKNINPDDKNKKYWDSLY